jgi:hypothetical protein
VICPLQVLLRAVNLLACYVKNNNVSQAIITKRKETKRNTKMLKFTASWYLHSALNDMNAPMERINVESSIFQGVVSDIQLGTITPEEGAVIVLDTLAKANYGRRRGDKR